MKTPATTTCRRLDIDALDQAIVTITARINAATYEYLVLIREFDERAGFLRWGLTNCTQWLHWRCDLSPSAAREKVRVAHALKNLLLISAAFASGTLSYSKVRALTRVANPDNEASLLDFAMTTTAARVEERCRQMRNVFPASTPEANRLQVKKSLEIWRNADRGTMTLTVELPIEEGELICQALDKAVENNNANGVEFESVSWSAQQAEALVEISRSHLNSGVTTETKSCTADHYQVMIHVDQTALTENKGRSDLPIETVKRLSCDGSIINIVENGSGEPIRLGRKQRTASLALKRALWARDRHCTFPGCTNTRFVDGHHVKHWSAGGETNLENMTLLCSRHHRLVHEGGYEIRTDELGRWYFRRPDGRAIPAHGYQPQDMTDDYLTMEQDSASAEGFENWSGKGNGHAVREPTVEFFHHTKTASAEGFQNWSSKSNGNSVREPSIQHFPTSKTASAEGSVH